MLEETHDVIIHPSLLEERDKSIFWCTDISTDSVHSVTLVLITTELKMGVGCFWIPSREFVFCLIWEPLFSSSATNCVRVWSEEKQDDGAAGAITLCILTPSGTDVQLRHSGPTCSQHSWRMVLIEGQEESDTISTDSWKSTFIWMQKLTT